MIGMLIAMGAVAVSGFAAFVWLLAALQAFAGCDEDRPG